MSATLIMRGNSGGPPPKKYTKSNLPVKDCIVCGRPMEWRKKWEKNWDEVKYCSERCRRSRNKDTDGTVGGNDIGNNNGLQVGGGKGQKPTSGSSTVVRKSALKMVNDWDDSASSGSGRRPMSLRDSAVKHSLASFSRIVGGLSAAYVGATIPDVADDVGRSSKYEGRIVSTLPANAATPTLRPTKKELEEVFSSDDWDDLEDVLRKSSFRRLDEAPDEKFYLTPRFVEHIDEPAVKALTSFHQSQLRQLAIELGVSRVASDALGVSEVSKKDVGTNQLDILDLCSSWTSHLPTSDYPPVLAPAVADNGIVSRSSSARVAGLGMNAEELKSNKQLTDWTVQDLNIDPKLPYASSSFDAVLLQLSIDYLTKPLDVLSEACRVLRPGGAIFISFSNRVFIDKAVAGWTGKSDIEHIQTVGNYLHYANTVQQRDSTQQQRWSWKEPFQAIDILPSKNSDPLYVVVARRAF